MRYDGEKEKRISITISVITVRIDHTYNCDKVKPKKKREKLLHDSANAFFDGRVGSQLFLEIELDIARSFKRLKFVGMALRVL